MGVTIWGVEIFNFLRRSKLSIVIVNSNWTCEWGSRFAVLPCSVLDKVASNGSISTPAENLNLRHAGNA